MQLAGSEFLSVQPWVYTVPQSGKEGEMAGAEERKRQGDRW